MSQQITRPVYNLGNPIMSAWIYNFLKNNPPLTSDTITLYYKTRNPSGGNNAAETVFVCDPVDGPYRGIENRFMTEQTYTTYTNDILTFIGYRTPGDTINGITIPALYNETLTITSQPYDQNFIQAAANYVDDGSTFITTVPFVNYTVLAASGIYAGYKNVKIIFFNDLPGRQRIVEITK